MNTKICPLCGGNEMVHESRPFEYKYKGHVFNIMQPADYCNSCDDGVINPEDRKAVQLEIQEHKARVDGILTPSEVKHIREKVLKLNRKKASEIFGGGVNAFSRYERGEVGVTKLLSLALIYLKNHPESVNEFMGARMPMTAEATPKGQMHI